MRKCDTCDRAFDAEDAVDCDRSDCPLLEAAGAAQSGQGGAEPPRRPPPLKKPPLKKPSLKKPSLAAAKLPEEKSSTKKSSERKFSLSELRARLKGEDETVIDADFDLASIPIPDSIEDPEPVADDDVEDETGVDPAVAPAEDPTILEVDFDIDAVPIPDSIHDSEPAEVAVEPPPPRASVAMPEEGLEPAKQSAPALAALEQDFTVEAQKPDLEAIRAAAAAAAREIAAEREAAGLVEETGPSSADARDLVPDLELESVDELDLQAVISEDPNFGRPPYAVLEYPEGHEPAAPGEFSPEEPAPPDQHGPTRDAAVFAEASSSVDWDAINQPDESLELRDVVDLDAWRDVIVMAIGAIGCIGVLYLAVTSWWLPQTVMLVSFGVVLPTCGVVGLLFLPTERRSEWKRVALRSTGLASAFALLVTALWASGSVRVLAVDLVEDDRSIAWLQSVFSDSDLAVSGLACRELASRPLQHNWLVAALDDRPAVADSCMADIDSQEHAIARNRLATLWQARLTATDATADTCEYVEHYAELPIDEDQKFFDFFTCAFGPAAGVQRCCADAVKQHYGAGEELVAAVKLVAFDRLSAAAMTGMVGPILRHQAYEGERERSANALALDDSELQRTSIELACLLTGTSEAVGPALEYLGAYGAESCSVGEGVPVGLDDWQQICRMVLTQPSRKMSIRDQVCVSIDNRHVAVAVDEASIRVHAALTRYGSRKLEQRIETGTVQAMAEQIARQEEVLDELVAEEIGSLYDVHEKQRSMAALEHLENREANQTKQNAEITARWESKRMQEALARRKNILRILMKTDRSWEQKVKGSGR